MTKTTCTQYIRMGGFTQKERNMIDKALKLVERLKATKEIHETTLKSVSDSLEALDKRILDVEEAKNITRAVALITQQQLQYEIADCVSNAQDSVFDQPYKLGVEFVEKRGNTECILSFVRDEIKTDPMAASGYGPVDIAALALRAASWALSRKNRPILILDEPLKHLKGEETNRRAIKLMHLLSSELGLQIITISDERAPREDIAKGADKLFLVTNSRKISKVTVIEA